VQVLDLAIVTKQIMDSLLVGLVMHVGHHYNPAFNGTHGCGLVVGLHVGYAGVGGRGLLRGAWGGIVDLHFVRHDEWLQYVAG
jgi:hypothetical protein